MLTDDKIIEMAKSNNLWLFVPQGREDLLIAFARLIESQVREEDARLVENSTTDDITRASTCAAAIREGK